METSVHSVDHTQTVDTVGCASSKFVVSFENLSRKGGSDSRMLRRRCEDSNFVLDSITGNLKPGLNAIMGPSGSGKTTLLNILAGRLKTKGTSGHIYYNGVKAMKNINGIVGYVTQNHCITETLTVKENLWFSANLKLSNSISESEKSHKIREVISLLCLEECQDSKVGTELNCGISGGERKRVGIGMELILRPPVLFLDEPTTGLDASTAQAIITLLKRLSMQGMNIIISIHQPRFSIFQLFDSLTLLGKGRLIFHGSIQYSLLYFQSIGYDCDLNDNAADFLLDVISGDAGIENGNLSTESGFLTQDQVKVHIDRLVCEFERSTIYANLKYEIQQDILTAGEINCANPLPCSVRPSSFSVLSTLSLRAVKNLWRNPVALVTSAITNLVIGVIFGLFYFRVDYSSSGVQNRLGFLFFVCSNMLFGSFGAVELFAKEHEIFLFEFRSGHYKAWQYFISKVFADLIPLRTICPILFCSVTYWMVGLKQNVEAFFIFILSVLSLVYAATGIGVFFSTLLKNFASASICISLTFVFAILFDGFLIKIDTVLPWLRWLRYFSIARYGFTSLCINEFRHQKFVNCDLPFIIDETITRTSIIHNSSGGEFGEEGSVSGNDSCVWINGEDILMQLSIPVAVDQLTNWSLWQNIIALACIAAVSFIMSYLQLLRRTRQ